MVFLRFNSRYIPIIEIIYHGFSYGSFSSSPLRSLSSYWILIVLRLTQRFPSSKRKYLSLTPNLIFCAGQIAKKPYNPIVGEVFQCSYHVPRTKPIVEGDPSLSPKSRSHERLRFIAEQVHALGGTPPTHTKIWLKSVILLDSCMHNFVMFN